MGDGTSFSLYMPSGSPTIGCTMQDKGYIKGEGLVAGLSFTGICRECGFVLGLAYCVGYLMAAKWGYPRREYKVWEIAKKRHTRGYGDTE